MFFENDVTRVWCHSSCDQFFALGALVEQYYIPARVACLVRPGRDFIVLPRHPEVVAFWEFCVAKLGVSLDQAFWTSGRNYLLDDDIVQELMPTMRSLVQDRRVALAPYSATESFTRWASAVPAYVFGDTPALAERFANKSILHPRPLVGGASFLERMLPGIRVARGYTCDDAVELLRASELLRMLGVERFVVKPVHGSSGDGIEFVDVDHALAAYRFPFGPVVLEERLVIDRDDEGCELAPSVQYCGERNHGECLDQVMHGAEFVGNTTPSYTSSAFQREALQIAKRLIELIHPVGPGGFDFLSIAGRPVLVDMNVGRCTGAHPVKFFRDLYAPRASFLSWKVVPTMEVDDMWDRLCTAGIAFTAGAERGVFPLCWLNGMWAMLIAIGRSREELRHLRDDAEACLAI